MPKPIRIFVVEEGERFDVHISGPNPNVADPMGERGGRTYEYVVANRHLRPLTVSRLEPPAPCWERVIEEDYR